MVVFGYDDNKFDIPKSRIIAVGKNVIVDMDFPEIFDNKVDRTNAPLPTGEPRRDKLRRINVNTHDLNAVLILCFIFH